MTKKTRKELIKALDKEFSYFIRKSHSKRGLAECYTCLWIDDWKRMDCGHYMSRKHLSTRWDPDNAKPQCKRCNQFHGGQPESFRLRLGEELSTKLEQDAREVVKWSNEDLEDLLKRYRKINKKLKHDTEPRQG